ncbi:MAG TPA: GreA/GreB family elongation factor [Candidatus Saccharimonadales bacterium]|nr:GreA/GreB family elongation factor [Candidatus Saccharimonadales bacterium]
MSSQTTVYLSKRGMKELKKEVSRLERDRQEAIVTLRELERIDNHEERLKRSERLAQLEILESELSDKKRTLESAKQLPRKRDALKVAIGSVVDLLDTNGRIIRYTIVESIEANPSDGRISTKSPLGRSLLGKQMQEFVEWSVGPRTNRLQLIAIT